MAALPSLSGVDVPAGPALDAQGNLRLTRTLRTYFDYFLSARHDAGGADALARVVYDDIRRRVPQPAAGQAWQLWQRYVAYLAEIQPQAARKPQADTNGTLDAAQVQQLRALLAERNGARQRLLPEVAAIWFGDEQAYDDAMLARLDLAAQSGLDDAQRQQRLAELEATLPEPLRAAREASARPQAISDTIAGMQAAKQDIARTAERDGAAVDVGQPADITRVLPEVGPQSARIQHDPRRHLHHCLPGRRGGNGHVEPVERAARPQPADDIAQRNGAAARGQAGLTSTRGACNASVPPGATDSGASTAMPLPAKTLNAPSPSPFSQPASRRTLPTRSSGKASSAASPCAMRCTAPISTCRATADGLSRSMPEPVSNTGTSLPSTSSPASGAATCDCR